MFITKTALPRRTFLKGTGVALALPFLDAMVPAATALAQTAAKPAMRFGAVYVPQGAIMDRWTPSTTGSDFAIQSDPEAARAVPRSRGGRERSGKHPR